MEVYTKIHLLEALKKAGLPHTYKSLLNYERKGIIPRTGEIRSAHTDRYYTKDEIEQIVAKVKALK